MKRAMVGVRELKAHLSAYLRAAAAGQVILVSDRRKHPIAQLAPLTQSADDRHLQSLEQEGLIRRGQGRPGQRATARRRSKHTVAALVLQDRR